MSRGFAMKEVVGISKESFADATKRGVEEAARGSVGNSWFEVVELRGHLVEGRVVEYQAKVRVALPMGEEGY